MSALFRGLVQIADKSARFSRRLRSYERWGYSDLAPSVYLGPRTIRRVPVWVVAARDTLALPDAALARLAHLHRNGATRLVV